MGNRKRVALLLVAPMAFLVAAAVLSGCGGGGNETSAVLSGCEGRGAEPEPSSRIQEAMALLAKPDLSTLTDTERDQVVSALREALSNAGMVHISSTLDEEDTCFGSDGRVIAMYMIGKSERQPPAVATPEVGSSETIMVYRGSPALFCDGSEDPDLVMVQQYVFEFGEWKVSAKAISPDQVPFGLLFSRMDLSTAKDAGFSDEEGQRLRGFTVPFPQPGDPEATVTIWVDLAKGLIRRVETTLPGAPGSSYPLTFDYNVSTKIEVPSDVTPPDCVPEQSTG